MCVRKSCSIKPLLLSLISIFLVTNFSVCSATEYEASSDNWLIPLFVAGAKAAYKHERNKVEVTPAYLPDNKKKVEGQLIIVRTKGHPLPRGLALSIDETITLKNIPITIALVSRNKNPNLSLTKLKQKYPYLHIQPNFYYYLNGKESRGKKTLPQYALKMLGFDANKMDLTAGRGIRIGIIDTPIDRTHPLLSGASITEKIFLKNKNTGKRHATALAGILVARGRLQGIVPNAMITSAGVFEESKNSKSSGKSTSFLLAKAFDYMIGARVNVLNLSFGSTERDELMQKLISKTLKYKIKIVASVGNDSNQTKVRYPAAFKGIYAITAIDSKSRLYNRANTGASVDYALPGVSILTSKPNGRYTSVTGTSFANAYAVGLIALQLSKNKNLSALTKNMKDLGRKGKDSSFGRGLLQARK